MKTTYPIQTAVLSALGALITAAAAQSGVSPTSISYSAVDDFSITQGNPNGVWSYGWMPTDFSSFNYYVNTHGAPDPGNRPQWWGWAADRSPSIWKNLANPGWGVPTGWLSLHPGNGTQPSVLRWTAPLAGIVQVTGQFLPGDSGWMQVAVRLDNQPWWQAGNSGSFDLSTLVAPGTTIDFAVYGGYICGNTPLSATITLSGQGCLVPPAGLVGWWPANGHAFDLIGGNHSVLQNGAGASAPGLAGQAFQFDGLDDVLTLPNTRFGALDLTNQQLTVTAWINLATTNQPFGLGHGIFDKYWDTNQNGYILQVYEGKLQMGVATSDQTNFWLTAGPVMPTNQWVHIAGAYDGAIARLYMNGAEVASAPLSGNILHNDRDAVIGNDNTGSTQYGFNGLIDEVAVFNRALPNSQIAALYAAGSAGMCAPSAPALVQQVLPAPGATVVPLQTTISATFTEDMNPTTFTSDTFQLLDAANNPVAGVVSYDAATRTATLAPSAALAANVAYRAVLNTGVTSLSGTPLPSAYSWEFHTWFPPVVRADLVSNFDNNAEDWRASPGGGLTWQGSGGTPSGYLGGAGNNTSWYFVSPAAWAGDWRGYRTIKFDLAIVSRHYADAERGEILVIVGANGMQMAWTADAPLWTWTHYEISLLPSSFGVDQATFEAILANVVELRVRAEYTTATETMGLDNVLVTAATPPVHETDLVSRFSNSTEGWRPVDDVTLSYSTEGYPSGGLYADDWQDGRTFKMATPLSWAGDWRRFRQLRFDLKWRAAGESATIQDADLVRIFGANGQDLIWYANLTNGAWTHREIPLSPQTFGVEAGAYEAIMSHVSQMWIRGEYTAGDDIAILDNVVLTGTAGGPYRYQTNLVARFHTDAEGWTAFDGGGISWDGAAGIAGGGITCRDLGAGAARFQSPDTWAGDWRAFQQLRFMVKPLNTGYRTEFPMQVWIRTWDGSELHTVRNAPYGSWTPYTLDLTPDTFGVTPEDFEAVMRDVAFLWIFSDLITGDDTTALDNVMLLVDATAGLAPDRQSNFETGPEGWRRGEWSQGQRDFSLGGPPGEYMASGGNPGACIANYDQGDWTFWFSPESWAGDWRGLQYASLDFKIINGTDLFDNWMIAIISAHGLLRANVPVMPRPGQWEHYQFPLSPADFGVTPETFDAIMRDVVMLGVRSEWVAGDEKEALDNVRLSKAPDAYWAWIVNFFGGADLADELIIGKLADPDGDGVSNWDEFTADTAPNNQLDCLRLQIIAAPKAVCRLQFDSRPGRLYSVEYTATLPPESSWMALASDLPGTGSPLTLEDTAAEPGRFYRLRARLGP